ncbi:hypothetical protein AKO1_008344 [Acrasis kona]|uniref:Tc1-like transposase DDE domain-containing protein n=1 Tax=Acrasis kona TaxID=1008807 RepID=A0AAW2YNS1_9EUKA
MKPCKIAKKLRINRKTVARYLNRYFNNEEAPVRGRPSNQTIKTNPQLINYIEILTLENPLRSINEIINLLHQETGVRMEAWDISRIRNKQLNFKRKRVSHIARKRTTDEVQWKRRCWRERVWNFDSRMFIYIDESHFDFRAFNRRYGYFKKGVRAQWPAGNVTRNSFSLIMAQSCSGIVHSYLRRTDSNDGGINRHDFIAFIDELKDKIRGHFILVLDNAKIHRAQDVMNYLFDNDIPFLFLPPYSPDYNPIELSFGYIKNFIQYNEYIDAENIETMKRGIQRGVNAISRERQTIENFTKHCMHNWMSDKF